MIAFARASRNAISTSLSPSGTQPHFLIKSMNLSTKGKIAVTSLGKEHSSSMQGAALIMGYSHSQTFFKVRTPPCNGLHLCEAAIHKQFRSRDVAAVVGCKKHHGLCDLSGCTEPAERNQDRKSTRLLQSRLHLVCRL